MWSSLIDKPWQSLFLYTIKGCGPAAETQSVILNLNFYVCPTSHRISTEFYYVMLLRQHYAHKLIYYSQPQGSPLLSTTTILWLSPCRCKSLQSTHLNSIRYNSTPFNRQMTIYLMYVKRKCTDWAQNEWLMCFWRWWVLSFDCWNWQ